MSSFRDWAYALCVTAVVCGMIQILAPKTNTEKMLKFVISIFFLCSLLTPFFTVDITDFEIEPASNIYTTRLEEYLKDNTDKNAKSNLEIIILKKLSEMGINPIQVIININSINIESVEIELDNSYESRHAEIVAELKYTLGLEAKLGYSNGGNQNEKTG